MNERFTVKLTERAIKDLERLQDLEAQMTRRLLGLELDPMKGHPLSGSLRG